MTGPSLSSSRLLQRARTPTVLVLCALLSLLLSQSASGFVPPSQQQHHYGAVKASPLSISSRINILRRYMDDESRLTTDWDDDDEPSQPPRKRNGGLLGGLKRWVRSDEGKEDIQIYFTSLFIALLLRFAIIEPRFIPSLSMYPTFEVGDQLAVEKVTKRIKPLYRNEVVVFNPPQTFRDILEGQYGDSKRAREALIKRIVAIEGDRVEVKGGKLFINYQEQDEPFVAEDAAYQFGPVTVPPGSVLCLGDNRNQSLDGHIWGFLPEKNVIGRAVFVYWPPWRIGNENMY